MVLKQRCLSSQATEARVTSAWAPEATISETARHRRISESRPGCIWLSTDCRLRSFLRMECNPTRSIAATRLFCVKRARGRSEPSHTPSSVWRSSLHDETQRNRPLCSSAQAKQLPAQSPRALRP